MIKLFTLPSSQSSRKAQAHLLEMGQPYMLQNMQGNRLTFEQLKEILSYTTEGTEEILANGKERKLLEAEGVDFENITLSEFHEYVRKYPKLIKAPIAIDKGLMVVGHDEERYRVFMPRARRMQSFSQQLEQVRANEEQKLKEGKLVSSGHWG